MKLGEVKPWEDPGFEEAKGFRPPAFAGEEASGEVVLPPNHDPNLDENESDSDYRIMEEFLRRNDDPEVDLVAILGEN